MVNKKVKAIIFAFLAAMFYAVNVPLSKILFQYIDPAAMAGFLYLGAGIGGKHSVFLGLSIRHFGNDLLGT